MTERSSFWCMLQAGPPSLRYYFAVVLHSCMILPPVGHSSYREYHYFQLTRQTSCVLNFYCTFKVFIWISLVLLLLLLLLLILMKTQRNRLLFSLQPCTSTWIATKHNVTVNGTLSAYNSYESNGPYPVPFLTNFQLSKFYYQLIHKRIALKGVLKLSLKQLQHVSV
jgi:uncharacterized Tic20 family protein